MGRNPGYNPEHNVRYCACVDCQAYRDYLLGEYRAQRELNRRIRYG